jgi:hypothetical protein
MAILVPPATGPTSKESAEILGGWRGPSFTSGNPKVQPILSCPPAGGRIERDSIAGERRD